MNFLDIWNHLTYVDGILFSLWIGVMYYTKCWIDYKFQIDKKKWRTKLKYYINLGLDKRTLSCIMGTIQLLSMQQGKESDYVKETINDDHYGVND